ncbi:MAG: metallophosphoesterase [Sakamotonia sp.]|jgi:predicted MPP superfamily phosphohydrolase
MGIIPGLLAAGAAAGLFLWRSEYEKDCLVTDTYEIRSPKLTEGDRTFVFLTDLHDKEFGPGSCRLLEAVRAAGPDAVLIGGDMMVAKGKGDLETSLRLIKALAGEFPVYCGNGNHELRMKKKTEIYGSKYGEYRETLERAGAVHLSDSFVRLGKDLILYGVDLPERYYRPGTPSMEEGFMERVLGKPDREPFSILLAHSPVFFEEYAAWGADLTLSGHFHGGTIRLPFLGGVMTPQYQFFYPRCAGEFTGREGRRMLVGRGLGTHSINIRFCDKPQVIVVKLKR